MLFSGPQPGADLRVLLVGQERVGKSSAGNTILGKDEFKCRLTSVPLTLSSEKRDGLVVGRRVTVVDTPGLFSTRLTEAEVKTQLEEALRLSAPGPHAFLLTLQLGRLSEQERGGLEALQRMLGPDVSRHTVMLFTYGDRLGDEDMDQFISEDQNLQQLLRKSSGRFHVFKNKEKKENRCQVEELLQTVDDVSEGGQKFYINTSQSLSLLVLFRNIFSFSWLFNAIGYVLRWFETHLE